MSDFLEHVGGAHTYDEDEFCETEGRKQAKIFLMKEAYKSLYQYRPFDRLTKVEGEAESERFLSQRSILFLTLNPKPGCNMYEFQCFCDNLHKRVWLDSVYTERFEETMNKDRPAHYHGCWKMKRRICPSQIKQALFRGAGKRFFGSVKSIDVKKCPLRDVVNIVNYIKKGDFKLKYGEKSPESA